MPNVHKSDIDIPAAFVPQRSVLTDSYAEEAAAAHKNRAKVAELENESLPRDLEDQVFGFFDELASRRSHKPAPEASPVTPPATHQAGG